MCCDLLADKIPRNALVFCNSVLCQSTCLTTNSITAYQLICLSDCLLACCLVSLPTHSLLTSTPTAYLLFTYFSCLLVLLLVYPLSAYLVLHLSHYLPNYFSFFVHLPVYLPFLSTQISALPIYPI